VTVVLLILHVREIEMLGISLRPRNCSCPNATYTCEVNEAVEILWKTKESQFQYTVLSGMPYRESDHFQVNFTSEPGQDFDNFISTLKVLDVDVNGTDLTCEGSVGSRMSINSTIQICIIGSPSPPTITSVMYRLSSALVSFQPPVYGAECVAYYTVTAISEEMDVTCNVTSDEYVHNCIPDASIDDFLFSVYSVTEEIDGTLNYGSVDTYCGLPFPENVVAVEETCGLQHHINVSWENSHMTSQTPTVTWHRVQDSEDKYSEKAGSKNYHQLYINHSVTGMLDIDITYSNGVCEKSNATKYNVEGVLTSISLNTSLIIESRDCIASPENYTLVVSFTNTDTDLQQSVNISFNSTVVHDVGDMLMADTVYLIIVVLVETTSDTVIDEMNTTIRTPPQPDIDVPRPGNGEQNGEEMMKKAKEEEETTTYIAVAAGIGGVLLLAGGGIVMVVMVVIVRKRQSRQVGSSDTELKPFSGKSQASTEERRYDTQVSSPPTESPPQPPSVPPDVIAQALYEDVNTLSRKNKEKEEKKEEAGPVYHVLEGPTIITPGWENTAQEMKDTQQPSSHLPPLQEIQGTASHIDGQHTADILSPFTLPAEDT
jgi:hypothetical protein